MNCEAGDGDEDDEDDDDDDVGLLYMGVGRVDSGIILRKVALLIERVLTEYSNPSLSHLRRR